MAGRGSGIGQGLVGGFGAGGVGGSQTSTRSAMRGQVYGKSAGVSSLGVHHWLWVLVAIEVGLLLALRVIVFRRYHGG